MSPPVSPLAGARPAIVWLVSRFPNLDPWSRAGERGAINQPGGAPQRTPVAPGIAGDWNGPSQVGAPADVGQRGWIEDRLLRELGDQLSPLLSSASVSSAEQVEALRAAVQHLRAERVLSAEALRLLEQMVANDDAVQQGRCALQEV